MKQINEQMNRRPPIDVKFDKDPAGDWRAVDTNTYDGSPDGNNYVGTGTTQEQALHNLLDTLADNGVYDNNDVESVRNAWTAGA